MTEARRGTERRESLIQNAWRDVYSAILDDAMSRSIPADRLRYRKEIDYRGFNETGSNYEIRVACYGLDIEGRPRVVVADIYEDDIQTQQVFSEAVWDGERAGISLTPSKVDKSYSRLSLLEVGTYSREVIESCVLEDEVVAFEPAESEMSPPDFMIFPVPHQKPEEAPN